jgi:hypothetical protein
MKIVKTNFKESFLFKSTVTAILFSILLGCTSNSDESAEETVATTPEVVVEPLAEPEAAPIEAPEPEPIPEPKPEPKPAPEPKPTPIVVKQEVAAPTAEKLKTVEKPAEVESEMEDELQDIRLDSPEPKDLGLEYREEVQEQIAEFDATSDDGLVLNGEDDSELSDTSAPLIEEPVEMTDAEKADALAARIERALARLADATYTFNPKKEVVVGDAFEVEAVMQLSSLINQDSGLLPDVESLVGQMKVDEMVQIELMASEPDALTIVAVSNPEQVISSSFTPKWRWSILANKEGVHTLFLKITPFINLENRDGSLVTSDGKKKTIVEELKVVAKPFNFWDWITTTVGMISTIIAILVIGALIVVVPKLVSKK